eukprot:1151869-Pelagomonas_calceolata.AAC.2
MLCWAKGPSFLADALRFQSVNPAVLHSSPNALHLFCAQAHAGNSWAGPLSTPIRLTCLLTHLPWIFFQPSIHSSSHTPWHSLSHPLLIPPTHHPTHLSTQVWAGNPAKKLRDIKPEERTHLKDLPAKYADMAGQHEEIIKLLKMKQQEYTL